MKSVSSIREESGEEFVLWGGVEVSLHVYST